MIDRIWWIWQSLDRKTRTSEKGISGTGTFLNGSPSANTTLKTTFDLGYAAGPPAKMEDLMSTTDGPMCYIYLQASLFAVRSSRITIKDTISFNTSINHSVSFSPVPICSHVMCIVLLEYSVMRRYNELIMRQVCLKTIVAYMRRYDCVENRTAQSFEALHFCEQRTCSTKNPNSHTLTFFPTPSI